MGAGWGRAQWYQVQAAPSPRRAQGGDSGLQQASAVTGHVFNMLHDNSKPCVGVNGPGSTSRHVMAPVMAHVDPEEPWSPCSARFITDFLDNGHGRQASAGALPFPGLDTAVPAPMLRGPAARPAVWGGVRHAAVFVWFPLPARFNSAVGEAGLGSIELELTF